MTPREIEDVFYESPEVLDVAVVGIDEPLATENAVAFVVLKDKDKIETLFELCKTKLPPRYIPKKIIPVDFIPKTKTGKVVFSELKEMVL
ncbi:long-chain-fatty-acid--CoA ligase truncation [Carboxydothermus islandicus]|uniref:Long-chain-fatty-acid--CoA ligase truncation n=1 Tax=Carboxydothermus islandicus TaxID=661089 RepID=A0A1L8D5S1_9THEO|nr:long-chain fatty acid--CoA ligase [Carboxydothermus islandicus]GAV26525.1 long-chain-fatty-acid--CoA ligase truncation [Carboxydothermus islandicus]